MSRIRILAWNLNHRAARRHMPLWIAQGIIAQSADVVVLTEYVEGPDHVQFTRTLHSAGLTHAALTTASPRQNQLLVAAREHLLCRDLCVPDIHLAVPSNAIEVTLERSELTVLGFRMPAFVRTDRVKKRETWEWLLAESDRLMRRRSIIVGDFNTAPGDSAANCGDCLEELVLRGWNHARPASGYSWRHAFSGKERQIDHLFASPGVSVACVEYDWDFESLAPEASSHKTGLPDHAMLFAEVEVG